MDWTTAGPVGRVQRTVLIATLLDIFAFSAILPLFPRVLDQYGQISDENNKDKTYFMILNWIHVFISHFGINPLSKSASGKRYDVVLFAGLLGSMFSFLQFLISPYIGLLSDKYGRKRILLISIFGNIISMLFWTMANCFDFILISRIIGGATKATLQLALIIISDISSSNNRSKNFSFVGIFFSLGFAIGPHISAYFSRKDIFQYFIPISILNKIPSNDFSSAAFIALLFYMVEFIFISIFLPETLNFKTIYSNNDLNVNADEIKIKIDEKEILKNEESFELLNFKFIQPILFIHFAYSFFFSGSEFVLTFLTHDRYDFTPKQQATLLSVIGMSGAMIQLFYTSRYLGTKISEISMSIEGMIASGLSSIFIGVLSNQDSIFKWSLLWIGAVLSGFTSGTVSTALTGLAAKYLISGKGMGKFRAAGQLGRTLGPVFMCSMYWTLGYKCAYIISAVSMSLVALIAYYKLPKTFIVNDKIKTQ